MVIFSWLGSFGLCVSAEKLPRALGDHNRIVLAPGAAFLDLLQTLFDAFLEAVVHCFFFFTTVGTAAQDESLVAGRAEAAASLGLFAFT